MPKTPAPRLDLKHLRLIAAIAEHGQISVAAKSLSLTQPAASRTLAEVEVRVGVPLFERNPRGMTVTDAGAGLARRARNILDELTDAADEVERLRLGRGGVVRIGAVTGAAVGYVVPAIKALQREAEGVEVHVEVGSSGELVSGLVSLRHDMVLARLPPGASPAGLSLVSARGERVRIVANRRHRLADSPAVQLSELAGDDWVMQGPGAPIRRAVEEAFLRQGAVPPHSVVNTHSLLMALALLRDPAAVTAVSEEVAGLLTGGGRDLAQLRVADPIQVAPYSLIALRDRRLSPVAERCRALLAELVGRS